MYKRTVKIKEEIASQVNELILSLFYDGSFYNGTNDTIVIPAMDKSTSIYEVFLEHLNSLKKKKIIDSYDIWYRGELKPDPFNTNKLEIEYNFFQNKDLELPGIKSLWVVIRLNLSKTKLLAKNLGMVSVHKDNYLITKDNNGNFEYGGKRIQMGQNSNHYLILDTLFSERNQNNFVSYEKLDNVLVKNGKPPKDDKELRKKRINNAIINGLFRFARVGKVRLKNETKDGQLIETVSGKGLKLNNPLL